MKKKILVHICCAPDLLYFLKRLREDFSEAEIIGFFYDPNIHPYEEYELRLVETKRICNQLNIKLLEGEYDLENWLNKVKGLEKEPEKGERCKVCFDIRLEKSFEKAQELGCNALTTTLLMSPKKDICQIKVSAKKFEERYRIEFLAPDYRKKGGTQEMFALARENEIYMQDYCGCIYGLFNQGKDPHIYLISSKGRRAGSREEMLFIKKIKYMAESMDLFTKEYYFPFMGWLLLQSSLLLDNEPVESLVEPYSMSIRGILKGNISKESGNLLYLNKGFLVIKLKEELKYDVPITFNGLIYPTFIVKETFRERIKKGKIKATLQARFEELKSLIMIIGNEKAEYTIGIPADTTYNGEGITEEEVSSLIRMYYEDIYKGRLSVVLLGAELNGKFGSTVFENIVGKKINDFMLSRIKI